MRIALYSDIHANLEALDACLAHARRQGIDRQAFLGDYVGYGAGSGRGGYAAALGAAREAVEARTPRTT